MKKIDIKYKIHSKNPNLSAFSEHHGIKRSCCVILKFKNQQTMVISPKFKLQLNTQFKDFPNFPIGAKTKLDKIHFIS